MRREEADPDEARQSAAPGEAKAAVPTLRCDTCGRATTIVSRVVIDQGYNRSNARPLWNCPDCYREKERQRLSRSTPKPSREPPKEQG